MVKKQKISYDECMDLNGKWIDGDCYTSLSSSIEIKKKKVAPSILVSFLLTWLFSFLIMLLFSWIIVEIDLRIQSPLFDAVDLTEIKWYHIFNPVVAPIMYQNGMWIAPTSIVCLIFSFLTTLRVLFSSDDEKEKK